MRRVSLSPVAVGLRDGGEKSRSGWHSSGVVKNPGNSSESLLTTVFFTNEHTTVIDFAQTTIQMGTRTQVGWATKKPCGTTPTMRCVLTGVRKRMRQPDTAKSLCRLDVLRDGSVCS